MMNFYQVREASVKCFGLAVLGFLLCLSNAVTAQVAFDFCDVLHTVDGNSGLRQTRPASEGDGLYIRDYLVDNKIQRLRAVTNEFLRVTPTEFDSLAKHVRGFNFSGFEPHCDWTKHATREEPTVRVTRPLTSDDGNLTIVAVSWHGALGDGHGAICLFRKIDVFWRSRCAPTWVH